MAVDYATLKKGGFMRQKQKDYFSLRIKVVGGNLDANAVKTVSEVAEKYGKGYVHFTSRQSVEIPFIHASDVEDVKNALKDGGCVPSVCGPRVRTVTACQGDEICPGGCIETTSVAKELDERYFGRELPHKFKFGVTGCQNNCLKAEENDVGIKGGQEVTWEKDACIFCGICAKVCRTNALTITDGNIEINRDQCTYCGRCVKSCPVDAWKGEPVYLLSFGGLFGNTIFKGASVIPPVKSKEQLYRITDAAIDFFNEHGNDSERFKFTVDRIGWEAFGQKMKEAYEAE